LGYTLGAVFTPDTNPEGSDSISSDKVNIGIISGSVAGAITLPLGIHRGNRYQGDMKWVLLTSVGMGAAGWALTVATENAILVPVTVLAQFVACIVVEKKTSKISTPRKQGDESVHRTPGDSVNHLVDQQGAPNVAIHIIPAEGGVGLLVRYGF